MAKITSYSNKLRGSRADLVYLVVAKNKGHNAWFIAEIKKAKKDLFAKAVKQDSLDLTKFGKVLYSGWGTAPPAEITRKLEAEYAA